MHGEKSETFIAEVKEGTERILGTESGVKIGLVLTLLGICAGGFAVWIWWAATISTKIDTMILQQTAMATVQTKLGADVDELKAWRKLVDTVGSGPVGGVRDDLRQLQKEFELHKARDPNVKTP